MKDVLKNMYGHDQASLLFYKAGKLFGTEFCNNILNHKLLIEQFLAQIHEKLLELSIGMFKNEKIDSDNFLLTITTSENFDYSGLPIYGKTACGYVEGFIAGIFHIYTSNFFDKVIDCWSNSERTYRFEAKPII